MISFTSMICPNLKSSASEVNFRPPSWVFGVIWPILYLTMGISWARSNLDFEYMSLTLLLCAWLVGYSCRNDKVLGRNILIFSTIFSYYLSYKLFKRKGFWLSIPLSLWLSFASYLNYAEVKYG